MKWEAATLLALLVVTSGCIFAGAATQPAEDLRSDAEDAANSHVNEPNLVEVWGVEPPLEVEDEDERLILHLDEEPGDGNAPGWGFFYVGDERSSAILTASGLGVLAEYSEDTGDWHEEMTVLEPWTVTSNEAASILQANETWPEMTDDTLVIWRLSMQQTDEDADPSPVWMVAAMALESDGQEAQALVDANSGEIIAVERSAPSHGPTPPSAPPAEIQEGGCEADQDNGQVTPLSDLTATVTLEEAGEIQLDTDLFGTGELSVALEGEDGAVFEWEDTVIGSAELDNTHTVTEGTYQATVSTPAGSFNGDLFLVGQWGEGACMEEIGYGYDLTPTVQGLLTQSASPYADIPNPGMDQKIPRTMP